MDPIQIEKLQAMKRYRRRRRQVLPTLILYLLSILFLGLFLSCPLWIFKLCSFLRFFSSASLNIMFKPNCLFVICNVIIVFLVGESKFSKGSKEEDIYEEFVKRNGGLKKYVTTSTKGKEIKVEVHLMKEKKETYEEDGEEDGEEKGSEELDGEEEEGKGLPREELNKRVEDFIAKVNKQRRLEARLFGDGDDHRIRNNTAKKCLC